MSGWKPWQLIETAPRDGSEILVIMYDQVTYLVVAWDKDSRDPNYPWVALDGQNYSSKAFSHWTFLLEPPNFT